MNEWVSVLVEMPDSDLLVLIYEKDQDPDVFLGYHDGECWRDSDATPCKGHFQKPQYLRICIYQGFTESYLI